MEYSRQIRTFGDAPNDRAIEAQVTQARMCVAENLSEEALRKCYSCLDLTSLEATDTADKIAALAEKVAGQGAKFPGVPHVASVCVYPSFVETVGIALGDSDIRITSTAGGFPSSQTFLEVKMLEAAMAVENGADEIDVVINVGQVIEREYDTAGSELEILREEIGEGITFKVILESGALGSPENIYEAALTAMIAGADFVKTSTGKTPIAATPEAAVVMCAAIGAFYEKTGRRVGLKVAGGIRMAEDAALYYTVVKQMLGDEWLTPGLFRIGASSVANALLSAITGSKVEYF